MIDLAPYLVSANVDIPSSSAWLAWDSQNVWIGGEITMKGSPGFIERTLVTGLPFKPGDEYAIAVGAYDGGDFRWPRWALNLHTNGTISTWNWFGLNSIFGESLAFLTEGDPGPTRPGAPAWAYNPPPGSPGPPPPADTPPPTPPTGGWPGGPPPPVWFPRMGGGMFWA